MKKLHPLFIGFSVVTGSILSCLVYLSLHRRPLTNDVPPTVGELVEEFRTKGRSAFRAKKEELKATVASRLKEPGRQKVLADATSWAVYLFPELLPDDNFEKSVATEMWIPQQQQIEENAPEGRAIFHEMRSNILNYETADKRNPALSSAATQVIHLYDRLTSQ